MSTRILLRRPDPQDPAKVRTASAIRPFVSTVLLVVGLHAVAAAALLDRGLSWSGLVTATITAASVAIGTAALVRQQDVVNAVFGGVTAAPHSWPRRVRAALAQVYQVLAGVHVGSSIAATAWFGAFTALVGWRVLTGGSAWTTVFGVAAAILLVLVIMTVCALPRMRERHHDLFETTHRFGGWLALALFAGLTVLIAVVTTRGPAGSWELTVADSPNTWILLLVAVIAVLPWLQLRRAAVQVRTPSEHVAPGDGGSWPVRPHRVGQPDRPSAAGPVARLREHDGARIDRVPDGGVPGRRLDLGVHRRPARPRLGQGRADDRRRLGVPPVHPGGVGRHRQRDRAVPAAPAGRPDPGPADLGDPEP
jgi:hypothetical protein